MLLPIYPHKNVSSTPLVRATFRSTGNCILNPSHIIKFATNQVNIVPSFAIIKRKSYRVSARRCCYGNSGGLIDGTVGGGPSDFVSPFSDTNSPHLVQLLHFEADMAPYLDCCKARESLCSEYHKFRPSSASSCQLSRPVPGMSYIVQ